MISQKLRAFDSKAFFETVFRPAANACARSGVTANQVTIAAIVPSFAGGLAVLIWPGSSWALMCVPGVLGVRLALDHVDGVLAREHAMASPLGHVLNEHLTVLGDAALYLPLAVVPGVTAWFVVLVVVLGITSEFTGVVAGQVGGDRRLDGPMGKKPRAVVFAAVATALAVGADAGPWLDLVLLAAAALSVCTIIERARGALAQARRP